VTLLVLLVLVPVGRRWATASETPPAPQEPVVDHDAPPEPRRRVAPFLRLGAEVKVEGVWTTNRDLDATTADDRALLTPEVALAVAFAPRRDLTAFLEVELVQDLTLMGPDEHPTRVQFTLKEAFVAFTDLLNRRVKLRLGRQTFDDPREWLFDAELDAVRVWYQWAAVTLEGSVSQQDLVRRELFHPEASEPSTNYLLVGRYAVTPAHTVAAYGLWRDDHTAARVQPLFVGLQAHGMLREVVTYWLEVAHVRGREGARRRQGYGVDLGVTARLPLPWQPAVTIGVAFGSGDTNPTGRVDRSFRQTGLHDNEGTFAGVAKFKYYGELLDPELSNLLILTGGIGLRSRRILSLDLVAHGYRQHTAAAELRDTRLAMQPTGRHRQLGWAMDLIVGYASTRQVRARGILGAFVPGRAFPAGADPAFFARIEVEYRLGHR
jgi:alginate production protein